MAYIYLITNDINGKVYVGKTVLPSIEERLREHYRDSKRPRCEKRPLYDAMNKYGVEHFHISVLEEVKDVSLLEEREVFWIEQKRSFKNGYNATLGGDGKRYLDYDVLISAYKEVQNLAKVAEQYGCDSGHLSHILKANGIDVRSSVEVNRACGQTIAQFSVAGEYIQSFPSAREAAKFVAPKTTSLGGVTSHITDVCKGRRKTAYGYIWKYSS